MAADGTDECKTVPSAL